MAYDRAIGGRYQRDDAGRGGSSRVRFGRGGRFQFVGRGVGRGVGAGVGKYVLRTFWTALTVAAAMLSFQSGYQ